VASFGGETAEFKRYDKHLETAQKAGYKKGWIGGANAGIFWIVLMLFYGVGLYAGARFIILNREAHPECVFNPILDKCFSGGEVVQSLFALISGAASLGFVFPNAKYVGAAQASAARLYEIIDREPPIDPLSAGGFIPGPGRFKGRIEFKGVTFTYPTRPDVKVLNDFSLVVEPGQNIALVGASGSGKSTIVALVLRWYDVDAGAVFIDGRDVKDYNVAWLRAQMGLVNQEPQLLPGTIAENIMLGLPKGVPTAAQDEPKAKAGVKTRTIDMAVEGDVTVEMPTVVRAAKASNCHDFISALPEAYETSITGMQLSGGQKQRVAIARAIIRDPRILLLDEGSCRIPTTPNSQ
jgi:ABC-type multidrug transport system fused ATPase/permease subunit